MNSPANDPRNAGGNAYTRSSTVPSMEAIPLLPSKLPIDPGEAGMVKQTWSAMRQCALEGEPHLWLSRVNQAVETDQEIIRGMERVAADDATTRAILSEPSRFLMMPLANLKH